MAAGIDVSTEALAHLAAALARFQSAAGEAAGQADVAAQRAMEELRERLRRQGREVERLRETIANAGGPSEDGNDPAAGLYAALDRAEESFARLERHHARASEADAKAQRARAKVEAVLRSATPRALHLLRHRTEQLRAYHRAAPGGGSFSGGAAVSLVLAIGTPAASSGAVAGTAPAKRPPMIHPATPLPPGFCWMKVSALPIDEELARRGGSLAFEKITADDLRHSFAVLQDALLPNFTRMFTDRETARRQDLADRRDPASGADRAWGLFFGEDAIYIDGGLASGISVANGLHRLVTARELGWDLVPVKMSPAVRPTR